MGVSDIGLERTRADKLGRIDQRIGDRIMRCGSREDVLFKVHLRADVYFHVVVIVATLLFVVLECFSG